MTRYNKKYLFNDEKLSSVEIEINSPIDIFKNLSEKEYPNLSNLPIMITYHDIGLNSSLSFNNFFNNHIYTSNCLLNDVIVVHFNAPGCHFNANDIKQVYTLNDIINNMKYIIKNILKIQRFICLSIGAGSYIFNLYYLSNPTDIIAMILLGINIESQSWSDYFQTLKYTYLANKYYRLYLLLRWFNHQNVSDNIDLVQSYTEAIYKVNTNNIELFINIYNQRNNITNILQLKNLSILIAIGNNTSFEQSAIHYQSKCCLKKNNTIVSILKVDQCGLFIHEYQPNVLIQPINLLLNGLGYYHNINPIKNHSF